MAGQGSMLPSVMGHSFQGVPQLQRERSSFDLSHGWKGTFNGGELIPFLCSPVLPGDTWNVRSNIVARLSTLKFPLMDNVFLDTFYFFVPCRLVWENWEKFQGSQVDPGDSIDYEMPTLAEPESSDLAFALNSLGDYFGLPAGPNIEVADYPVSLPFRAYNLIWNEWFRDENLQDSVLVPLGDGPDTPDLLPIDVLKRGKRHDYFTSCLLLPQKGDSIVLPLGTTAPIIGNGQAIALFNGDTVFGLGTNNGADNLSASATIDAQAIGQAWGASSPSSSKTVGLPPAGTDSGMIADLSSALAPTILAVREAFAFQHVLETDSRGGTRYTEMLSIRWGIRSQDSRLQRPEYLGGSSQKISVSAVAQTTASPVSPTVRDAQAGLAGYAVGTSRTGFVKSFPEHGYIIALVNVRADITYSQGMDRHWSYRTRFDWPMPELMHLSEQAVLNKEIFFTTNNTALNNTVFGYQERFAEMRYMASKSVGLFRPDAAGTLAAWHLGIDFPSVPSLDATFIEDDPPFDRVITVTSQPAVLMDCYHSIRAAKQMPMYGVPGLMRL